jgi:outer membrane protein OmpA-like peptidoglycan-associated protein
MRLSHDPRMRASVWGFEDQELDDDADPVADLAGPDALRLEREAAFARNNPGFVSGVGTRGGAEDNEFVFWNYAVGSAEPRPQHAAVFARVGPRWRRSLARDRGLRIKVVGSASSSSGDPERNRRLALARAQRIARILVNVFSIPTDRIDVEGVGADQPMADELNPDDPMNMARDRRVEVFLHAPARLVSSIRGVSVPFSTVTTNLDAAPELRSRDESDDQVVAQRSFGIRAVGRATWAGPPGALIGFLQFVVDDVRRAFYRSDRTSRTVAVDFGRCTGPFLPCFDALDSSRPMTCADASECRSIGQGTGRFERVVVRVRDAPGFGAPRMVLDPVAGPSRFVRMVWRMDFALVFGVRLRDQFSPIEHVLWRASSTRPSPSGLPVTGMISLRTGGGPGAPPGLPFARAMAGASCRLRTRSMDLCSSNRDPRRCPPDACAGAVTRF